MPDDGRRSPAPPPAPSPPAGWSRSPCATSPPPSASPPASSPTKAQAFDRLLARARAAAEGTAGIDRLHAVVAELLPVDAERRGTWRLLVAFHGSAVGSAAMRRAHDRRMTAWFTLFAELVAPLGVPDPEATGMALALFVEGMAVHTAMMQPPRPAPWQVAFAREQVERLVGPAGHRDGAPPDISDR